MVAEVGAMISVGALKCGVACMSGKGISNEVEVVGELLLAGMSELIESAEETIELVIINDEMILSTSVCLLSDLNGNIAE